jgi:hypothetical protein
MTTGQIIFSQLKYRMNDLMVWGSGFLTFNDNQFTDISHLGGLIFKVNGLKHKKHVMIRLAPNDTYIVEIGTFTKSKGTWVSKTQLTNIYCDMLHETIDRLVEGTLDMSKEEMAKAYENELYI